MTGVRSRSIFSFTDSGGSTKVYKGGVSTMTYFILSTVYTLIRKVETLLVEPKKIMVEVIFSTLSKTSGPSLNNVCDIVYVDPFYFYFTISFLRITFVCLIVCK